MIRLTDEEIIDLWMREPAHRISNIVHFARALLAENDRRQQGAAIGCVYAIRKDKRPAIEWFRRPGPAGTLLYTATPEEPSSALPQKAEGGSR